LLWNGEQNDIGHVLAHTSSAPEYSDYVDLKTRDGDFDISIIDLEGTRFETEGVLDALVQQVSCLPFRCHSLCVANKSGLVSSPKEKNKVQLTAEVLAHFNRTRVRKPSSEKKWWTMTGLRRETPTLSTSCARTSIL
jgi:hypothetical protein